MRQREEDVLRKSHEKYEELVNTIEGIVWEADPSTFQFTFVSKQAERFLGYPCSQWLAEEAFWKNHLHSDDLWVVAECQKAVAEKRSHEMEYRMIAADGRVVWLRDIGTVVAVDDRVVRLQGVMTDITARKRTEREMLAQQCIFEGFFQGSPLAIAVCKKDGYALNANQTFLEWFGFSLEELRQQPMESLIVPEDLANEARALASKILDGEMILQETVRKRKGGSLIDVSIAAYPVIIDDEVAGVYAVFTDISQRKAAEREIHQLSTALEQTADSVLITNRDGVIEYVNAAFEKTTGYSKAEAVGKTPRILKSGAQDAEFYRNLWGVILSGEVYRNVLINRRKDGKLYHEEKTITPLRDAAGGITHFISSGRDISERHQHELELRQAAKMEAVGRLAGGVAHDFNNLMTAVLGYADFLLEGLDPESPLRSDAEEIKNAGSRAVVLTRQLLTFSRRESICAEIVDLNALVHDISKMLRRLIGEDIELKSALAPEACFVKADPGLIEQVIMNLSVNARDAMPKGGTLSVSTAIVSRMAYKADGSEDGDPAASSIMLKVSDTGCGMDAETKSHIFEPFFTTKEVGKGTGLGLSIVYRIVCQSGGSIEVESEPGRGTTFRIYLPHCAAEAESIRAETVSAESHRGFETVMVVEDESGVRSLVCEILRREGYRVLQAGTPADALRLSQECAEPIHLLLTDIVMPRMSGLDLAREIQKQRPAIKVLYMSGYTADTTAHHGVSEAEIPLLRKPFTSDVLTKKVREALDGEDV